MFQENAPSLFIDKNICLKILLLIFEKRKPQFGLEDISTKFCLELVKSIIISKHKIMSW
jgi:hypothetical protein